MNSRYVTAALKQDTIGPQCSGQVTLCLPYCVSIPEKGHRIWRIKCWSVLLCDTVKQFYRQYIKTVQVYGYMLLCDNVNADASWAR